MPEKDKELFYDNLKQELNSLMEKQFALSYYTSTSYKDTLEMTPFELDNLYHKLVRVKELETEKVSSTGV